MTANKKSEENEFDGVGLVKEERFHYQKPFSLEGGELEELELGL